MEMTKGRAVAHAYLFSAEAGDRPRSELQLDELFANRDAFEVTAGIRDHAPELEPDGTWYYPGIGSLIPVVLVVLDARDGPKVTQPRISPAIIRSYRDAAMAHLNELDKILEAGTDQLANMTWSSIVHYVAMAELLTPTSPVRKVVTSKA